ncbi:MULTISPECIES: NADH-quinone oxidoreductase subunit J [Neorhizobium]|jgi:NADH-quinone oxidoreductase subunit J|uniref:NADH-quinone oxidoreductase subunit J n=1 Tax=Neorhizobium galegae bv. officinalis TaxID=323656 RepID=A0A0T7G704_NEOGA|nr:MULTISPECIES: NADH-quinone oxidoreductase subunit J [Neorhizobium]KAA9386698.1 NADH-quinone oxidoreductase subunit J [Neorhizobium galegae]KAB1109483.1 NADH-quinone oxidoreductase subunit J [Neorhizobium galegae]MCM2501499.1 NADH-quinone oxidoreductase subunit J [Neorhizobium galegae]MCQ1767731.1 NADH-quinone oxidoreductase subunit J [Neorhizobium galegae]MCQ1772449.1 NADH-quinone oxidoreductase subunit J [Neorhizobium galegae]
MGLQAIFFYLFAFIAVASAFMVISAKNPVHSVLFLILVFFNAAGLFLLTGAEFLAMILLVVYIGAVAVLFLFVVMMLDIDFAELRSGVLQYAPIGMLVGLIVAAELVVVIGGSVLTPEAAKAITMPIPNPASRTNTAALGDVLYTNYVYFFQIAGLVLLVAMIGAIVLTLRHRTNIKRQDVSKQVARTPATAVEVVKVKPGQGV